MKFDSSVDLRRLSDPREMFANKTIPYPLERISSCAIIGNSGKVLNNEYGSLIDSHDCVVRLNSAPIVGWERYVGSKNTFRFVNGMVMKGEKLEYNEIAKDWLSSVTNERVIFGRTTLSGVCKGIYQTVNANEIYFLSKKAHGVISSFEKTHKFSHMTMGLLATVFFLKIADVVNLFGFGFNKESLDNKHYWETFSEDHDGGHNWSHEQSITIDMHKNGIINIVDWS